MVSNIFYKYFSSVYSVNDNLPLLHIDTPLLDQMPAVSFDPTKIISTIHSIKSSSSGPDKIHSKILKKLAVELSIPLSILFTKSCNTSTLLIAWKTAHICPIFKGLGSCFLPENYKTVALTSVCKIMESIIKNSILLLLSSASLLSLHQRGFLPKRSTLFALPTTTFDWLNSFCTYRHTHCVFFDLRKAFNSISRRKLL